LNTITVDGKVVTPSKIICIGRNYVEHIAELGNEVPDDMVVFTKPNSAISHTLVATQGEPIHYEGEICFMYEKGEFSAVGFGLDLTKRQLQGQLKAKGLPWERAKAFDGAAIFSDFTSINNMHENYEIQLTINDELTQKGDVSLMMYSPAIILKELALFMTLEDGDIVMTGTPKGVGVIHARDKFTGSIWLNDEALLLSSWVAQ